MDVHAAGALRFRFPAGNPLPVYVLPAVVVSGHEVQQHGVHGVGVQAADTGSQHGKHSPETRNNVSFSTSLSNFYKVRVFAVELIFF